MNEEQIEGIRLELAAIGKHMKRVADILEASIDGGAIRIQVADFEPDAHKSLLMAGQGD